MERLTEKIINKDTKEVLAYRLKRGADVLKSSKKLGEYEDLEEQGLLIRLPCKVGTDIYYILGIPNETPCVIESCVFELTDIHRIGKT